MRIVTWNAARGSAQQKLSCLVDRLDPDIVALQEIAKPEDSDGAGGSWRGKNENCGILVWAKRPLRPVSLDLKCRTELYHFVRIFDGTRPVLDVLNLWVKPFGRRPDGECPYGYSLCCGLKQALRRRGRTPKAFMGDLNILNPSSKEWYAGWLKRCGLFSAYHFFLDEQPGEETHPTHEHRSKKSFHHIDWCFLPEGWKPALVRVKVGARREWGKFSDHFPIVVDVKDSAVCVPPSTGA